jgi:hypothetical protein
MQGFEQKMYPRINLIYYNTGMYRRPSRKKEIIRRSLVYTTMSLLIAAIVTGLIFIILGYSIDTNNGKIERSALLRYDSIPSGATIAVDGKELGSKTPAKSMVIDGSHTFTMTKDGYLTWTKKLDIQAGTLTWLSYVRLVPVNRAVEAVASYPKLSATLATTDGQKIAVQPDSSVPSINLVDVSAADIKTSALTLPTTLYTDAGKDGVSHKFRLDQWDTDGRYLLVEHDYTDALQSTKVEWLVIDTNSVGGSRNITKLLDLDISSPVFAGTSGNILYVLSGGDIRKLDLSAQTISRSLVTSVSSFGLYDTNVITYVGALSTGAGKRVVGLYRDGDSQPHVLRTIESTVTAPVHIATSRYYNADYVAISVGSKIDILSGNYPASGSNDSSGLSSFASFDLSKDVANLSFSPKGYYVLAQSGTAFTSYDIEHQLANSSVVTSDASATVKPLLWLDSDHVWSDYNSSLSMRDFDGTNTIVINQVAAGFDASLTHSGRYFYSVGKTSSGYQLQRVRMILP